MAHIYGSAEYPDIRGYAVFLPADNGTVVSLSVYGLPPEMEACGGGIFAVHIHSGSGCTGNTEDRFADAGAHYDPRGCMHPFHGGDMPPLFAAGREAHLAFVTNRFTPEEVIGRTIIIHSRADDLATEPSGNSGKKIACGEIVFMQC